MAKAKDKRSFAELMAALGQVVENLEHGELSLEEMLAQYQQGVLLIRDCQQRLHSAEAVLQPQEEED